MTRSPNLLLIGAPRCASTSLADALSRHPDIFLPHRKETHFLAMHGRTETLAGIGRESFESSTITDPGEWQALFAGRRERWCLDASVSTMSYPETAIGNITEFCDRDTLFLVILRNPVDRAYSSFQYCASRGWTQSSFEDALAAEEARRKDGWQHLWHLRHLGRYEERLAPFIQAFGQKRLHIVLTEDLERAPDVVMNGIWEFLNIPACDVVPSRANDSGMPRGRTVARISYALNRNRALKSTLKAAVPTGILRTVRMAGLRRTRMDTSIRERLVAEFRPTRVAIEQRLGRALLDWR